MQKPNWCRKLLGILLILILISSQFSFAYSESHTLRISFIDVGQADSILITLDSSSMLIDAGNNADGNLVVNYLRGENISKLNYVIGTHPHEDHIGGLDDVIAAFDVETILMPKALTTTSTFNDVLDAVDSKGLKIVCPKVGAVYSFGDASFTILSCKDSTPKDLNYASIVIRLVYGNDSFLFMGDATSKNENEILASNLPIQSTVIKLGHHGSDTSSMQKFLKAVNPAYAIISVGTDNNYGHPSDKIIKRLSRLKIKTLRTDFNGTIVLTSTGSDIKIETEVK